MGGGGDHEETRVVSDLWELAAERITLEEFLSHHGYHGPLEGEISGRVWREDPTPIPRLAGHYRSMPPEAAPSEVAHRRDTERVAAERELIGPLAAHRRGGARAILALARRNVPMRGIGKVTFLQSLDVARAASQRIGAVLAEPGRLDDPEDVFYLTYHELCGDLSGSLPPLVEARKRERAAIDLTIADDTGYSMSVHGTVIAAASPQTWPNIDAAVCLARWECDGRVGYGDFQDARFGDCIRRFRRDSYSQRAARA
jgi:hypothetical protein